MIKNNLEIIFIYLSSQGREVEFNLLSNNRESMDLEDYDCVNFLQVMGGIKIIKKGYYTVFYNTSFYNLMKITDFILNTLYLLNDQKSNWFNNNDSNNIKLNINDEEYLLFSLNEKGNIIISYLTEIESNYKLRGKHYFEEEVFEKVDWVESCSLALEEYFNILNKVLENNCNKRNKDILKDYLNLWEKLNTQT